MDVDRHWLTKSCLLTISYRWPSRHARWPMGRFHLPYFWSVRFLSGWVGGHCWLTTMCGQFTEQWPLKQTDWPKKSNLHLVSYWPQEKGERKNEKIWKEMPQVINGIVPVIVPWIVPGIVEIVPVWLGSFNWMSTGLVMHSWSPTNYFGHSELQGKLCEWTRGVTCKKCTQKSNRKGFMLGVWKV